jgi:type VI protein secretion system component VasF
MSNIEEIAQVMQSKGYCEKSSYRWICYVLASMVDESVFNNVEKIAKEQ